MIAYHLLTPAILKCLYRSHSRRQHRGHYEMSIYLLIANSLLINS
jgi:hypothetical protein